MLSTKNASIILTGYNLKVSAFHWILIIQYRLRVQPTQIGLADAHTKKLCTLLYSGIPKV